MYKRQGDDREVPAGQRVHNGLHVDAGKVTNKAEIILSFGFLVGDHSAVSPAEAERLAAVLLEQGNKAFVDLSRCLLDTS